MLDASEHAAQAVAREQLASRARPGSRVTVTLVARRARRGAPRGRRRRRPARRREPRARQPRTGAPRLDLRPKVSDRAPCPVVVVRSTGGRLRRRAGRRRRSGSARPDDRVGGVMAGIAPRPELRSREARSSLAAGSARARGPRHRRRPARGLVPPGRRNPSRSRGTVPGMPALVRSLLAGPTRRERARGLRSAIPAGTALRDLRVARQRRHRRPRRTLCAAAATSRRSARGSASSSARCAPSRRPGRPRPDRGRRPDRPLPGLRPARHGPRAARRPRTRRASRDVQQLLADLGFMAPTGVTGARATRRRRPCSPSRSGTGCPATASSTTTVDRALLRARAPGAGAPPARQPGRDPARPPGRAPDRRRPRRAGLPHLVRRGRPDADRLVPRLPQGAHVVVGAVLDLDAVGELLHRRASRSTSTGRCRRTRPRTAASG